MFPGKFSIIPHGGQGSPGRELLGLPGFQGASYSPDARLRSQGAHAPRPEARGNRRHRRTSPHRPHRAAPVRRQMSAAQNTIKITYGVGHAKETHELKKHMDI